MFSFSLLFSMQIAKATPQLTEVAKEQAESITSMDIDNEPVGRLLMAMAVIERKLDKNARFALAGPFPNIVEMVENKTSRRALEFLIKMPPTQRNALRRGETILRTPDNMKTAEIKAIQPLIAELGLSFKGFKGIRIGAFDRLNVTIQINTQTGCLWWAEKKTKELLLAWPGTPIRNEKSRNVLTKKYNARPDVPTRGPKSIISLNDPSFESYDTLSNSWSVYLANETPKGTVEMDTDHHFDGKQSLRFYNTKKTRAFPRVMQWARVNSSDSVQVTFYAKSDNLRVEQITTPTSYADEAKPPEVEPTEAEAEAAEIENEDKFAHAFDPGDDTKWSKVIYNWDKEAGKIAYVDPDGIDQVILEDSEAGLHLISKLDWQPGSKGSPKDQKKEESTSDAASADQLVTPQQKLGLYAQFYDGQNHPIGDAEHLMIGTGTKRWIQYQLNMTAPEKAERLQVSFNNEYAGTLWIDAITIHRK